MGVCKTLVENVPDNRGATGQARSEPDRCLGACYIRRDELLVGTVSLVRKSIPC